MPTIVEKALKYGEDPKEEFKWCEKLENHLSNHKWETILNDAVKRMLLSCITESARQD